MAKVFNRMCNVTFFFLIIIKELINVIKTEIFKRAFNAGNAFVNDGGVSGRGNPFHPIRVTSMKTIAVKAQIPILIPLCSLNFGVFESNV